jgi:hypothetical protein
MSTSLTAAQALLTIIDTSRRSGSTTVLLQSPKVVSGEALFVACNQTDLDLALQDCPTLRGTTLQRLKDGLGDTRGPVVFDLSTVYVALLETVRGPRDPHIYPYEIVGFEHSREIIEKLDGAGDLLHIEPKPGSEKAWINLSLPDGTVIRVEVPYTVPASV